MTVAKVRAAVEYLVRQGQITPQQLAAFSWLDEQLTAEQRNLFTEFWRATGSPAAPAVPFSGTLQQRNFPFCAQTDNGPEGWRQCQTSSIAMALIFLKTKGIKDDLDYLKIVQRYGDTTIQESHRKALAELGVKAQFRQNLSHADALVELKIGLPVVAGVLHHGPVSAPNGGGHYVAIYGATATEWLVNDPYGELDLVNGGWSKQGNGSGRARSYSFRNFDPRWLPEGPRSGWGWVFS